MRVVGLVLSLFCATLLFGASAGAAGLDDVDAYIRSSMERARIPGAAVAIVRDGKPVLTKTWGTADLEWGAAVDREARFQIASSTKTFTGVLTMMLVQEGKLGLDDPISKYIADVPDAWKAITVRHLATHTSGLARAEEDPKITSMADAVAQAKERPMAAKPGEAAMYGSPDFTLLAAIIEQVTGRSYPEALRERILVPLDMRCTGYENASQPGLPRIADVIPKRVTVYRLSDVERRYWFFYPRHSYAAGGLFSCIDDMSRFMAALQAGALLRPETLRQMWTAATLKDGSSAGFGIGWTVSRYRGRLAVGHSGGPALADVLYFPEERLGIVVLTNQQRLHPVLAQGIADLLLAPPKFLSEPGIADARPQVTQAVRKVLTGMASGQVDSSLFGEEAREELAPALASWGPLLVGLFDPLSGLMLLKETVKDSHPVREYRAIFGTKTLRWIVQLDEQGRIIAFDPESE